MRLSEYQEKIKPFAFYPEENEAAFLALGLANEAGETAGKVKKFLRGDYDEAKLKEIIEGEIGDVLWYLTMMSSHFGLSMEEIMQHNYDKIVSRKERGTQRGDGDGR